MAGITRFLAVFYHAGSPLPDGTQKLGYMLYDAVAHRTLAKGAASCISSGGQLSWAGFSNDGSLMAMDSTGMLSMLVGSGGSAEGSISWEWMPMLDTVGLRKSADDSHWPITVKDGKLVCVPLKGGIKYPDAVRRPVTTALGLRLPLARGNLANGYVEKSAVVRRHMLFSVKFVSYTFFVFSIRNVLEELSVRADIALGQKKVVHDVTNNGQDEDEDFEKEYVALSAQVDKVTLKMFAAAVEAGKLERAVDLVERLHLEQSFDLAMQLADHHHRLVDLIEDAKNNRFGEDEHDEEFAESPEYTHDDDFQDRQRITPDGSARKGKRPFDSAEEEERQPMRSRKVYA